MPRRRRPDGVLRNKDENSSSQSLSRRLIIQSSSYQTLRAAVDVVQVNVDVAVLVKVEVESVTVTVVKKKRAAGLASWTLS